MFVDEVEIRVRAGKGGSGAVSFRREKFAPQGGPDGGDGGRGGDVVLVADAQKSTLLDFRFHPDIRAPDGENGGGSRKTGRSGEARVLHLPPGTVVYDAETGAPIVDLGTPGARFTVAAGGKGGWGNARFATPTDQVPMKAGRGLAGEARALRLELKLLADVGLVGFPNAGKSTLIAAMSAARPKIGDYAFTTLVPNLGVVDLGLGDGFVMADIPGLIEGAHAGAGLGHRFLRHVERCRVLVYLLAPDPGPGRTPCRDWDVLARELTLHDAELAKRPAVIVLNKADLPDAKRHVAWVRKRCAARGLPLFVVSAATREGLTPLVHALGALVKAGRG